MCYVLCVMFLVFIVFTDNFFSILLFISVIMLRLKRSANDVGVVLDVGLKRLQGNLILQVFQPEKTQDMSMIEGVTQELNCQEIDWLQSLMLFKLPSK